MVATRAIKRAIADSKNPLQHAGLREHIFSFVGPSHFWFVAQVSKGWKTSYQKVEACRMEDLSDDYECFTCTAGMTMTSAAFASAACCSLATGPNVNGAIDLEDGLWRVQRYAGQFSDLETLQLALARGLAANDRTLQGAAESGSLRKVQWLHAVRQEPLPVYIGQWAARSGNLELLAWLTEQGCEFSLFACAEAAEAGHKHVLCYQRERECEWDEHTTAAAATHGHLSLLQWLLSSGCPIDSSLCSAAQSGSIEMMVFARQRGCEMNARTMQIAADRGRLTMCKYLHSEGCPWDTAAPHWAAYSGHVDTLRWLHEQNCPCSTADVAAQAATGGSIEAMRYVLHEAALATPELLTDMLNAAGAHEQLEAAQWLRQQGADWPRVMQHEGTTWNDECLPWVRQQGCTAPLYDYESHSDGSDFSDFEIVVNPQYFSS
jgi:hypothetical protein